MKTGPRSNHVKETFTDSARGSLCWGRRRTERVTTDKYRGLTLLRQRGGSGGNTSPLPTDSRGQHVNLCRSRGWLQRQYVNAPVGLKLHAHLPPGVWAA